MSNRRSPRAARLARNEPPVETETPASESTPPAPADDRAALLNELDRIIQSDGPDPAKVSAIGLKAKLLGMSDPPPADPEDMPDAEPATPRDITRAILAVLRESSADVAFYCRRPGYRLIEVPDHEAPFVGGRDPIEYDAAQERGEVAKHGETLRSGPDVPKQNVGKATAADIGISRKDIHEARRSADGSEIRCNGYTIQFGECAGQSMSRPVAEWVVTNAQGVACGRRLTSEDAIALAKALPGN